MTKYRLFGPNSRTAISESNSSSLESFLSANAGLADGVEVEFTAIFCDFDDHTSRDLEALPKGAKRVLLRNEPKVVRPQNHKPSLLKEMDLIVDVGRPNAPSGIRVNWPQTWNLAHVEGIQNQDLPRANRFAVINAHKLSFVPGELYSLRRHFVNQSTQIDTWGPNWDATIWQRGVTAIKEFLIAFRHGAGVSLSALKGWFDNPNSYRGLSSNKLGTLANYRYSLVIENSMEFMTEKLFDSLFAGTLPIYVGPDIELFGIPSFVAVQASPNVDSVTNAMRAALEVDLVAWRIKTLAWLKSEGVEQQWSSADVFERIVSAIEREL
jgi:hypothetical protein